MTLTLPLVGMPLKARPVLSAVHSDKTPAAGGRQCADDRDQRRLQQACADFEALLIQKLFQTMRAAIPQSGLVATGPAQDIYTSMLDQQVARDLALQGGLGLSSQLKAQIARYMEDAVNADE